jgi:uncharacterized membrane protein
MEKLRQALRLVCATFFVTVGFLHFLRTKSFERIIPKGLPFKRELVLVSGVFEILGGIGLVVPFSRQFAGKGLVALLVAVFPANINMAVNKIDFGVIPRKVLWWRLPVQIALIGLVRWVSR